MGSKAFLSLGLSLAIVLLISSELAAARGLAETFSDQKKVLEDTKEANGVDDAKYGGYEGNPGGRYGGYPEGQSRVPGIQKSPPGGNHSCLYKRSPGRCPPKRRP